MQLSKKRLKLIVGAMALAALALIPVLVFKARRPVAPPSETLSKVAASAVVMLSGVHQTAAQDGKIKWELTAESAQLQDKGNRMLLDMPTVEFILDDGGKAYLTAARGILNTKTNDIEMQGNVEVRNGRYTLQSEELEYDHDQRVLRSKTAVRIISSTITLNAASMIYDLKTNQARFSGAVEGNVNEKLPL